MRILEEQLGDFIAAWERAYGERPDRDWARVRATELLELFTLLAQCHPSGTRYTPPETP